MICRLHGKVAIITGGASGLGEATARLFAEHGAAVIIADIQDELGQNVAASIGHVRCKYVHCDVSDESQIKQLVEQTTLHHGRIDVLFCNAGIVLPTQTVLDLNLDDMDRVFGVNVRGPAALIKHGGRAMVEAGVRGSIICTASVAGSSAGVPGTVDYTMAKHAVVGLARAACSELGKHGIRVNCISPSIVSTPLVCRAMGLQPEEVEERFSGFFPLQGVELKAKNIADVALFLASDDSSFVSGHNLVVDGGYLSR